MLMRVATTGARELYIYEWNTYNNKRVSPTSTVARCLISAKNRNASLM